MKKNKMMRAASGLLVAVLLTTSVISGTFAKYTTTSTGTDKARVAYWGFNQNAELNINLFDDTYANVDSENGDNVIAPGTSKSTEFGFQYIENTAKDIDAPEVAYNLTINAVAEGNYTALDANPNFKWTLKSGKTGAIEGTYNTVAELVAAIKALSGSDTGTKRYEVNELPDAFGTAETNAKCTVGWVWDFETATGEGQPAAQDATDTAMGNATTLDNVELTITVTATQID